VENKSSATIRSELTSQTAVNFAGTVSAVGTITAPTFVGALTGTASNSSLLNGFGATVDGTANAISIRTSTGGLIASGTGGFASGPYVTGARNPIWKISNSEGYGLSYFQGSAGHMNRDTIG